MPVEILQGRPSIRFARVAMAVPFEAERVPLARPTSYRLAQGARKTVAPSNFESQVLDPCHTSRKQVPCRRQFAGIFPRAQGLSPAVRACSKYGPPYHVPLKPRMRRKTRIPAALESLDGQEQEQSVIIMNTCEVILITICAFVHNRFARDKPRLSRTWRRLWGGHLNCPRIDTVAVKLSFDCTTAKQPKKIGVGRP